MSSFAWSGVFREGQWRAFRKFILEERRDAGRRELAILGELDRIGDITVVYGRDDNGRPTETRAALSVTSGSSLAKLLAAYTALGGNPFDISMFLSPDKALPTSIDGSANQPSGGVSTAVGMPYSYGGRPTVSDSTLLKYKPSRVGGNVITPDGPVGELIARGRKWVSSEIRFKRNALEHRILKLCDLREQLVQELDAICWAVRGYGVNSVNYDPARYDDDLTVAKIVYTLDAVFRVADEDGTVRTMAPANNAALAAYPNLVLDDEQEKNTAL